MNPSKLAAAFAIGASALAAPFLVVHLTGATGESSAGVGVFHIGVPSLGRGQIASGSVQNNGRGLGVTTGGSGSQSHDAVVISNTIVTDAFAADSMTHAATLDLAHAIFAPGMQHPASDPALSGPFGSQWDPVLATLNGFGSVGANAGVHGFGSAGGNGSLAADLLSPIAVSSPTYLDVEDVGRRGGMPGPSIAMPLASVSVPEPISLGLFGIGLAGLAMMWRRRRV